MKIEDVSTPVTLKTMKTHKGEFILKGDRNPRNSKVQYDDPYTTRYLKLYKKVRKDGLDTFQLVAKKEEKSLINGNSSSIISIRKESYNPLTNALTEQSCISKNVYGGHNLECSGDVFTLSGSVSTNIKKNKAVVSIDTTKGQLTPMAKRIMKLIIK